MEVAPLEVAPLEVASLEVASLEVAPLVVAESEGEGLVAAGMGGGVWETDHWAVSLAVVAESGALLLGMLVAL